MGCSCCRPNDPFKSWAPRWNYATKAENRIFTLFAPRDRDRERERGQNMDKILIIKSHTKIIEIMTQNGIENHENVCENNQNAATAGAIKVAASKCHLHPSDLRRIQSGDLCLAAAKPLIRTYNFHISFFPVNLKFQCSLSFSPFHVIVARDCVGLVN